MVTIFDVTAKLCELSNWSLTNLQLQKMTYISQMFHLGQKASPLFDEDFEAWDLGPVSPALYHELKGFGDGPVGKLPSLDPLEAKAHTDFIERVWEVVPKDSWELVRITHWDSGAWAKHYKRGVRDTCIPKEDIEQEYKDRWMTG